MRPLNWRAVGMTLVDRRTEFGLRVDRGGEAEVHVFQGRVELQSRAAHEDLPVGHALHIDKAGGVESISLVQTSELRIDADPALGATHPDAYMPMLQTAEVVARRYGVSRERCDAYSLRSQ